MAAFDNPHGPTHHAADATAVIAPLISWLLSAPQKLQALLAFLGCVWYCITIGKEISLALRRRRAYKRQQETKHESTNTEP